MGTCSSIKSNICICLDSSSTIALNNQSEKTITEKQTFNKEDNNTNQVTNIQLLHL